MMPSRFYMFMLIFLVSASSHGGESLYFLCETDKGDVKLFAHGKVLSYEFYKNNNIELSYHSLGDKFSGFSHNYYYRYQTEYGKVSFNQGGYKYAIYSRYEENEEMSGVIVSISGKEYNIPCRKVIENKLVDLIPLLQCDRNDALGCYPNK